MGSISEPSWGKDIARGDRPLSRETDGATTDDGDNDRDTDPCLAAQIVVNLLERAGRLDEAIDVAAEYLAGIPESALACPSVAQLCLRAGQPAASGPHRPRSGEPVTFAAALLS